MSDLEPASGAPCDELVKARTLAQAFRSRSRAPATLASYRQDWQAWSSWCSQHGCVPIPADPQDLCAYCADMAVAGRKLSTIKRRLATLSVAHEIEHVHPNPVRSAYVRATLTGIARTVGSDQRRVHPLLPAELRRMVSNLRLGPSRSRDAAILLLGFGAALRRSEISQLDYADVTSTPDGMTVTVRRSKTDQEGRGRVVGVPYSSDPRMCPVRTVEAWCAVAGWSADYSGPLFVAIDRWGKLGDRLSPRAIARIVKVSCERSGLRSSCFSGHSLRAGFATAAAKANKSESSIARQTGHRSLAVLHRYIRMGTVFQANAAEGLLDEQP